MRGWVNASNFTRVVGAVTAVFCLVVVARGTYTGLTAVLTSTMSVCSLLALTSEQVVLWRRRRLPPPSDDK